MEEVKELKAEQPKEKPQETEKKVEKKEGPKGPSLFAKIKEVLVKYKRVIDVAQKPDQPELVSSLKITIIGIGLIGFIGFVIFIIYRLVVP